MTKQTEPVFKQIQALLKKATDAQDSGDAMRFAQAASNAANALCALRASRKED